MRFDYPLVLTASLLLTPLVAHAARPSVDDAEAAYSAKQYATCALLYEAVATTAKAERIGAARYGAAACWALDHQLDAAYRSLKLASEHGWHDLQQATVDADLAAVRADARWPKFVTETQAANALWEKTLTDAPLRRQILAMVAVDQAARDLWIKSNFKDQSLLAKMNAADKEDTAHLKEIVAAHGWPTKKMVGSDGAGGAWLLVQHADADVNFQKECLAKMEPLVATGEVEPKSYAYLVDRVAVAEKRKQTYGTQFAPNREPQPIEDEAHVDERRKAVGLGTMAEYRAQMARVYGWNAAPAPSPKAAATATVKAPTASTTTEE